MVEVDFNEFLHYVPETGKLFWRERAPIWFKRRQDHKTWNKRFSGKEAFITPLEGYLAGALFGKTYYAHRVIWKMVHGYWPNKVDHDNRTRTDNRLDNLVDSNSIGNNQNLPMRKDNTTGYTGVSQHQGKFMAIIATRYIGMFNTALDAHHAYEAEKTRLGFHAKHGLAA
ncbi:HNH endonuclease [Mesorhizobium sp. STM 4661]|uniref:HNH endonuclease n=1 Tax=Mesorhizobium sp. STM 4661 TaxID=1297570 RepID=UPI0002BDA18F|nr:HNH endonuclease [Mesorhizobium sp. STM 4661]CCV12932.1 putative phage associated protein [Mesorhizobium sp. STM 4661]